MREPVVQRVVIAGGGVAAIEALLALRAAAGRFDVTVLAPDPELVYRPLAVVEPSGRPAARRYRLDEICADVGATLVPDRLAAVDGARRVVVTGAGAELPFDALVLATGARAVAAVPGAVTVGEEAVATELAALVRDAEAGAVRSAAFVVPPGGGWSLPLYELALTAAEATAGTVALTLVTAEELPLAVFGGPASEEAGRLLRAAGVELVTGACVAAAQEGGLRLEPGGRALVADRVVALARLRGPAIAGVPSDAAGFVRVDDRGRVPGLERVWAIGDATTFPVKQGGLAAQQADTVVAALAGDGGRLPRRRAQLRAILLTGGQPRYLTVALGAGEEGSPSTVSERCPWWPPHKIAARHLAPYLADREPVAAARPGAARSSAVAGRAQAAGGP